jgi:hypothetical protein
MCISNYPGPDDAEWAGPLPMPKGGKDE